MYNFNIINKKKHKLSRRSSSFYIYISLFTCSFQPLLHVTPSHEAMHSLLLMYFLSLHNMCLIYPNSIVKRIIIISHNPLALSFSNFKEKIGEIHNFVQYNIVFPICDSIIFLWLFLWESGPPGTALWLESYLKQRFYRRRQSETSHTPSDQQTVWRKPWSLRRSPLHTAEITGTQATVSHMFAWRFVRFVKLDETGYCRNKGNNRCGLGSTKVWVFDRRMQ